MKKIISIVYKIVQGVLLSGAIVYTLELTDRLTAETHGSLDGLWVTSITLWVLFIISIIIKKKVVKQDDTEE